MKKVFIAIIETEYGEIDEEKMRKIKKEIESDFDTWVEFYELKSELIIK